MALAESDKPLDLVLASLATPGGITAQGLAILREDQAFAPWERAYESVRRRLAGDSSG
jgi:pyrroline-5-carboxylate reductase